MNDPMAVSAFPAGERAYLQLKRSLEWEASFRPDARYLTLGACAQLILLSPWFAILLFLPARESRQLEQSRTLEPIFLPPRRVRSVPPLPRVVPQPRLLVRKHEIPVVSPIDIAVDLNAIKLSIADDVHGQLPEVVRKNNGELALLDREDKTIAYYTLKPPSWALQDGIRDVSRKVRLIMQPSEKWEVFRAAAEQYNVRLDRYQACAIFDTAFRHCLQDAIRNYVLNQGVRGSATRVTSAVLAFESDWPCGIEVLEVSLATASTP